MVRVWVVAAALLTLLVGGCTSETGGSADTGDADCERGVLFNDGEYVGRGYVEQTDKAIGSGVSATCEDTEPDSRGLVFGGDGKRVEVWSLPGVSRSEAVAIKVGTKYEAMLNKELSEPRRAEIVAELGLDESDRVSSTDAAEAAQLVEDACADFLSFYAVPQSAMVSSAESSASQTSRASKLDPSWDALAKRMTEWAADVRDIEGGVPLGNEGAERSIANGQAIAEQCRTILHIEVSDPPASS